MENQATPARGALARRILLTGAAGTLGAVVGNALAAAGWDVIGCDLRPHPEAAFPIVVGDLHDPRLLATLLQDRDALVHFAAYASPRLGAPSGIFETNTTLDAALLHAALAAGVRRIVFSSSVQVISAEDGLHTRPPPFRLPPLPLDGTTTPNVAPDNPYARGKLATEQLLETLARPRLDHSLVALRFPWVVTPAMRERATRRVAALANGHAAFAFLPVEEVGRVVAAVLRAAPVGYRCYFPAARENLLFAPPAEVIAEHLPDAPLRCPIEQITALVDDRALATETGWIPAPVTWGKKRFRRWCWFFQRREFRRFASRCVKIRRHLAHAWLELRTANLGRAEVVLAAKARLGEGPCWDARAASLLWVDILAGVVHRFDPQTGINDSVSTGQNVSVALPCDDGRVLVGLQESLALLNFAEGTLTPHRAGRVEGPPNRFNDGKCDATGRLWIGSAAQSGEGRTGALFRIEGDGPAVRQLGGVACSNGLGWSPDGRTFYYIDSGNHALEAFDFDCARGTLGSRRTVLRVARSLGSPDGACVDREGGVWIALYGGGCIIRVDPVKRRIVGRVAVPVSQVTSCTFGGPDLEDLYITTARQGLDPVQLAAQPLAGAIFRARPGVRGWPAHRFSAAGDRPRPPGE